MATPGMPQYRLAHLMVLVTLAAVYFAWVKIVTGDEVLLFVPFTCFFFTGLTAIGEWRSSGRTGAVVIGIVMIAAALVLPLVAS